MGQQNMYSQATRQNIKSIIQSLNNPRGQAANADQAHAPKRPQTQLGQAQQAPAFPAATAQQMERTPAERRDSPSSLSYDQHKKYLSNQKQKQVPLLSKSQQYPAGLNAIGAPAGSTTMQ